MTEIPPAPSRLQRFKELLAAHEFPSSWAQVLKGSAPETPVRMAWTITLAILCGSLPIFGLGLLVLIPLLILFRLNKALGIGAHVLFSNPWTMGFICGSQIWFGLVLLGRKLPNGLATFELRVLAKELMGSDAWKDLLSAYLLGGLISSVAFSALVFAIVWITSSIRSRQPQTS